MATDVELDRLKAAQDLAFQRKQRAYEEQESAWQRRKRAGDVLNRAHEEKQRAYEEQNAAWENLQRIRGYNGPRIDRLNTQQESAFESMKRAYDNASSAYNRRDGASAKSYAEDGRRYKEEAQCYVQERRRLVDEIRAAKARLDAIKPTFQRAKADFDSAKRTFDQAKADHARAQAEFKRAKIEFDQAVRAFKARLEIVKAETARKKNDKRSIAEKAGIPYQYCDKVWISTDSDGNTNIYFGGSGKPNGPGHGHYVMNRSGSVTYRRDPLDPHGSQNFTDDDSQGGTLYNRRIRSGSEPTIVRTRDNDTRNRDGVFYDRNRDIDLHVTQVYEDNKRVSWDTDGKADQNLHWTDQSKHREDPGRHKPPPDAR